MDSIRLGPTRDSLLHFIARHPDSIHLLKWLLAQAPFLNLAQTNLFGQTTLHVAVLAHNTECLRLCLSQSNKLWCD